MEQFKRPTGLNCEKKMDIETLGYTTEERARGQVADGWAVEVECLESADQPRKGFWVGRWRIYLIDPDAPDERRPVVTVRAARSVYRGKEYVEFREYTSLSGLTSFLTGTGIRTIKVPLDQGETARCSLSGRDDLPARPAEPPTESDS